MKRVLKSYKNTHIFRIESKNFKIPREDTNNLLQKQAPDINE